MGGRPRRFPGAGRIGAVQLHPWNATVEDFERADRIAIDLDPSEGVQCEALIDTALRMRELMEGEGFVSWPKLTGGKGIHPMAPLEYPVPHNEAHRLTRRLIATIAGRFPDDYILAAQARRRGRIFLDYLRNGRGTTGIGAYSPRARKEFPIAAPVT
jgi:bifunctional non-homologous end joining protein LigD